MIRASVEYEKNTLKQLTLFGFCIPQSFSEINNYRTIQTINSKELKVMQEQIIKTFKNKKMVAIIAGVVATIAIASELMESEYFTPYYPSYPTNTYPANNGNYPVNSNSYPTNNGNYPINNNRYPTQTNPQQFSPQNSTFNNGQNF